MKTTLFILIVLSLGLTATLQAAAGDLDPLFGNGGIVNTDISSSADVGYAIALQSDGKLVVAGNALNLSNGQNNISLVRYNPNGSVDPTFGTGGRVTTTLNNQVTGLVLQNDGKVLVSGINVIARFNPNGSADPTFGSGGTITGLTREIAVQSDGKIIAVGDNGGDFGVKRFNPNGSLDPTFGNGGVATTDLGGNEITRDVAIQSDSKIVACGTSGGTTAVIRYNPNGSLDPTFGNGGIVIDPINGSFHEITIQQDNKILLGGQFSDESIVRGGDNDFAMLRYNPNGTPDPTFGTAGQVIHDIGNGESILDLAVQPNGKIVAVGFIFNASQDFAMVRYNTNGSPDNTFGSGGIVFTDINGEVDAAFEVTIQPDGFIVVAGSSSIGDDDFTVARYEGDLIVASCSRFTDVFEDGVLAADWDYVKQQWTETGGNLTGTPIRSKAEVIATPAFSGCTGNCTFQTSIQTAGGLLNKIFFFAWFQDKQNTVEVLMTERNDKWVLRQRASGGIVAKTKALKTILPNVPYDVKVVFDGTTFTLFIDGVSSASMIAGAAPSGTVGYRVKNTTARFAFVCVD
jgi:uncharacterized delta-60 repeat protein